MNEQDVIVARSLRPDARWALRVSMSSMKRCVSVLLVSMTLAGCMVAPKAGDPSARAPRPLSRPLPMSAHRWRSQRGRRR